jgi:uncharacterized protein YaaQ
MKMIFAIIKDDDVENVSQALTVSAYRFTRVATTGGLFKKEIPPFSAALKIPK